MIEVPFDDSRSYDEALEKQIIPRIRKALTDKEDDFLLMVVGQTGSGKSNLLLHMYEEYDNKASVDYISLNRKDFADSLKSAGTYEGFRFVGYDEANISKRDSMSKWNKAVLDLYYSIRGLRIFHVWCNPSMDIIDKKFVEERIKGMIVITSKHPRVRTYFYFTKRSLLKIYNKYGNLRFDTITKVRRKYALYRGWFKLYNGKLLKPYLEKKADRMVDKVEEFQKQFGTDKLKKLTSLKVRRKLGVSPATFDKHHKILVDNGKLVLEDNFVIGLTNRRSYDESVLPIFEESIKSLSKNGVAHR